jgi:hypothetical protein
MPNQPLLKALLNDIYPSSTGGDSAVARVMLGTKPRLARSSRRTFRCYQLRLRCQEMECLGIHIIWSFIGGCLEMFGREFFGIRLYISVERLGIMPFAFGC